MLDIKNLRVDIKSERGIVKAVRGVDIFVKEGEIASIVGESGSGKSILCKSIVNILPKGSLVSGEINFNGKNLNRLKNKELREIRGKEIGVVFQNPMTSLDNTITVGKQIEEALKVHKKLKSDELYKEAIRLMELVKIENAKDRYKAYPYEFSGGMRQRICIAIGIANNPKLLIADEITTALDMRIQKEILNLLEDLKERLKIAILFISHDLRVVYNISDRVYVMYGGRVVEEGLRDEIFKEPRHPYTKALLKAVPKENKKNEDLETIEGNVISLINPPKGDPFAMRDKNSLNIEFRENPPKVKISKTHYVYSWQCFVEENIEKVGFFKWKTF